MAEQVERRIDSIKAVGRPERRVAHAGDGRAADGRRSVRDGQDAEGGAGRRPARPATRAAPDAKLNRRLGKLAKRAEDIAAELEQP